MPAWVEHQGSLLLAPPTQVIAATNRADILDPALLRPGRFDRRVPVELPDRKGREAILKVHARDKPLGPDVSLAEIAARTTGLSGASLRNLLNEAAIVAARRSKSAIGYDEIDYAIDRIQVGLQRIKERGPIAASQRLVAYHEAGHALMALLTPGFDAVTKVCAPVVSHCSCLLLGGLNFRGFCI